MIRAPALLTALLLASCGDPDDPKDTQDSGTPAGDCEVEPGGYALDSGTYTVGIDAEVFNDCENAVGHGLHIHVGEDTMVEIAQTGECLLATSDPGSDAEMPMTGATDGESFTLDGGVSFELGTCVLTVHATMTGTLTADSAFDYRMDATLSVEEEMVEGACEVIIGDEDQHTFPFLPCDQAWTGTGTL